MARTVGKLTEKGVAKLPPGRHSDGNNLYLVVKPTGGKSWIVQWRLPGEKQPRSFGLGGYSDAFGLAEARIAAAEVMANVRRGVMPSRGARAPAPEIEAAPVSSSPLYEIVAEEVIGLALASTFGKKTEPRWRRNLFTYAAALKGRSIESIGGADVEAILLPMWATKHSSAVKLRENLERVFAYAMAKGWHSGPNPARWKDHLQTLMPRVYAVSESHPACDWASAPKFLRDLGDHVGVGRDALELVIYTGARTGEVQGATWSEIDLKRALWSIPRERCKERRTLEKAKRTHKRIPLSAPAVALLQRIREPSAKACDYLFPHPEGGKPMSENAMLSVVDTMKLKGSVTPRGFRSTYRDWAAAQRAPALNGRLLPAYSYEAAEMALGHTVGTEVTRAYLRSDLLDERRELANDWADYLHGKPPVKAVDPTQAFRAFLLAKGLLAEFEGWAEAA